MILQHVNKILAQKEFVLASSSPRRKEILEKLGLNLTIIPSTFEEKYDPKDYDNPGDFAIATARGKAEEVAKRVINDISNKFVVIGADTCISLGSQVFGKPKDHEDAFKMLSLFSGCSHNVVTGVSVLIQEGETWNEISFCETTTVKFGKLVDEEIDAYIATGEPMDKAGSYGIQGLGGALVESIEGDYYNVMGFPLHRFCCYMAAATEKVKT
ncbi:dTTP/UTP pyrophosphatase [Macrobrachium rosenbergii]|uniref:dTTP/UTP pyrophosphatase n=1 Tax=Macrobrachium rosenbergii TaxID=79674 RepID=UPI0034D68876